MELLPEERLRRAQGRIDRAWLAALVAAALFVIIGLMAVVDTGGMQSADWFNFGDAALVVGLAWGVAKRSRLAAAILLFHLLLVEGILWSHSHSLTSALALLIFGALYTYGLLGTLEYHQLIGAERNRA